MSAFEIVSSGGNVVEHAASPLPSLWVQGSGFKVLGFGFGGLGFRVRGFRVGFGWGPFTPLPALSPNTLSALRSKAQRTAYPTPPPAPKP